MIRCYIAGAYSKPDPAANTAKAMAVWHELADLGFAPFCPHLSHFLHIQRQRTWQEWLDHDLVWLRVCQVLLRIPGESPGADTEEAEAIRLGIPIVRSIAELQAAFGGSAK